MSSRSRRTAKPSAALLTYFSQLDGLISPGAEEVPLEPDRADRKLRKVGYGSNPPGAKGNKGDPKKNPAKRREKVAPPLWDNSTGEDVLKFDAPEKFDYLRCKGLSKWWPAMIINERGGGLVDVEYYNGEVEFALNRSSFKKRFPYKPEPDNKVLSEDESEEHDGKTFLTLKWDDSEEANPLPIEGDIVKLVVKKKREKEKKMKVGPGRKKGSKNSASKATSATVKKDVEQNSARSNKATTTTVKRKVANVEVKAMEVTKTTPKKKKMRSPPRHEHGPDILQSFYNFL